MGWFTKADDQFVEKALDDARRGSAIADLNTRRVVLFVLLLLFVVCAVLAGIGGGPGFGAGGAVFIAIYASMVSKMNSDLRLLKVIDRLRKEGRLPPPDEARAIAGLAGSESWAAQGTSPRSDVAP